MDKKPELQHYISPTASLWILLCAILLSPANWMVYVGLVPALYYLGNWGYWVRYWRKLPNTSAPLNKENKLFLFMATFILSIFTPMTARMSAHAWKLFLTFDLPPSHLSIMFILLFLLMVGWLTGILWYVKTKILSNHT